MKKNHFIYLTTSAIVLSYSTSSMSSFSPVANVYATNGVMFDTTSPIKFIESMAPHAKKLGEEKNLYASVMIAQAALESGYGKSTLTRDSNNLFGVKEKNGGNSISVPSKEFDESGKESIQISPFKVFDSHLDSLKYYAGDEFLNYPGHFRQTPWYMEHYKGVHRSESSSYKEALQVLQGRYATDPLYAQKLQKLIVQYDLTRYDAPSGQTDGRAPSEVSQLKTSVHEGQVTLTFVNPTDIDFSHVVISRDGTIVASKQTTTSYVDKGLQDNAKYTYTVKTVDEAGNTSAGATVVITTSKETVTTSKETVAPATFYTVKKGDTLSKIARMYNTTYQKLMEVNNLKATTIKVGQKLKVTTTTSVITTPPATPQPTQTTTKKTGTVTASSLNVRSGAGTNFKKVTTLKRNQVVTVNSVSGKWANVTFGTKKGYVHTDYVKITTTTTNTSSNSQVNTNTNAASKAQTYTVKKGDTLSKISRTNGVSVQNLKTWNGLKNDTIKVGQKLTVKK